MNFRLTNPQGDYDSSRFLTNLFIELRGQLPNSINSHLRVDYKRFTDLLAEHFVEPKIDKITDSAYFDVDGIKVNPGNQYFMTLDNSIIVYVATETKKNKHFVNYLNFHYAKEQESNIHNFLKAISKYSKKEKKTNKIHVVVEEGGVLSLKSFEIKKPRFSLEDNYDNISELHRDLIKRLNTKGDKGIALFYGEPGCLGKGTGVIMFDGSIKNVEDINPGDLLMGPDSTPRTVLETHQGESELFDVNPVKGESWVCNDSHIHVVHDKLIQNKNIRKGTDVEEFIEIDNSDVITGLNKYKNRYKLVRSTGIDFSEKYIEYDSYFLGLWLGDGKKDKNTVCLFSNTKLDKIVLDWLESFATSIGYKANFIEDTRNKNCTRTSIIKSKIEGEAGRHHKNELKSFISEKCFNENDNFIIPNNYLYNTKDIRLKLLAGIIDSDGHRTINNSLEISTSYFNFSEQLLFLCRSLGFAAYRTQRSTSIKGRSFISYRISISGEYSTIPTKLKRKQFPPRKQIKSVTRTGFNLKSKGIGEWYGLKIDGDHRFLLSDFTITHNCGKTNYIRYLLATIKKTVIYLPPDMAGHISSPSFIPFLMNYPNSVLVIEDAENIIKKREGGGSQSISNLLNLGDGLLSDILSIQIVGTFNCNYKEIDEALLRKGRLICKHEFGKLSVDKGQKLSKKLGFKHHITEPMTLSDIYNQDEKDYKVKRKSIGFVMPKTEKLVHPTPNTGVSELPSE